VGAVVIVFGVVAIAFTGMWEANHSKGIKLLGTCNSTEYILPDSLSASVTNVTVIDNGTTRVLLSTAYVSATEVTLDVTSYTTTLTASSSTHFVVTNTSTISPYPSPAWVVATCTFGP